MIKMILENDFIMSAAIGKKVILLNRHKNRMALFLLPKLFFAYPG